MIENISLADRSNGSHVGETSKERFVKHDVIRLDRNFQVNDFALVKFDTK